MQHSTTLRGTSLLLVAALAACAGQQGATDPAATPAVEVQLCDGETSLALAKTPTTREEGQAAADAMMASWKVKNPGEDWEQQVRSRHWFAPMHDNSGVVAEGQGEGHPGRRFTERDVLVWQRETETLVTAGARIFHSGDELGSTIAVSCDMCHPDAANTHPETYPKYQTQMGKAVLLRDMINWCLEHPVRAQKMAEDDPRMRALEAYIYAQRSGTPLAFGKH
jgi:thiosulfate dehydrogenase